MTNINTMTIEDAKKYIEIGLATEGFLEMWDNIETEVDGKKYTIKNVNELIKFCDGSVF